MTTYIGSDTWSIFSLVVVCAVGLAWATAEIVTQVTDNRQWARWLERHDRWPTQMR